MLAAAVILASTTGCGGSNDSDSASGEASYLAAVDRGCAQMIRSADEFGAASERLKASLTSPDSVAKAVPVYRRIATSYVDNSVRGFRQIARPAAPRRFASFRSTAQTAADVFSRNGERIKRRIAAVRTVDDFANLKPPFSDWGEGLPDASLPDGAVDKASSCRKILGAPRR